MKKPIPWAVALVSIFYWGALIWWQNEALFGSVTDQTNQNAIVALVLSVVYVGMLLLFFMRDTPESISELPFIGKMFRSTSIDKEQRELLIFITPNVVG